LVGFYGPPYHSKRLKAWFNLYALLQSFTGLWLCFEDFNSILSANEKEGGRRGSSFAPNFLRNLMFELGAVDLGFSEANLLSATKGGGTGVLKKGLIAVLLILNGGLPSRERVFITLVLLTWTTALCLLTQILRIFNHQEHSVLKPCGLKIVDVMM
jgi:hypothetical protein